MSGKAHGLQKGHGYNNGNKNKLEKSDSGSFAGGYGNTAMGCGGSKTENTTVTKEFVYVPEYQSLDAPDGADQVFINGDTIYYRSGSYNEEAQKYEEYLSMQKIGGDFTQKVPLDFGENSNIHQINMDKDGSFLAILSTYVYDESGNGEDDTEEIGETTEAGEAEDEMPEDADATEADETAEVGEEEAETEEMPAEEEAETGEAGEDGEKAGETGTTEGEDIPGRTFL